MGIFGWSLPPGVTHRMIDEAMGCEGLCEVCGNNVDECICPECPRCGVFGEPECYNKDGPHYHGLTRTIDQDWGLALAEEGERQQCAADAAEAEYWTKHNLSAIDEKSP